MSLDLPRPQFDSFNWALHRIRTVWRALEFVARQVRSPIRLPLRRTLWGWRHGFGKLTLITYGLPRRDYAKYVSEYSQFVRAPHINKHYDYLLNNKLFFPHLMKSVDLEHPRLLGASEGGKLTIPEDSTVRVSSEWIPGQLGLLGKLVIKPVKGRGGCGLMILEGTDTSDAVLINGKRGSIDDVVSALSHPSRMIITEFVSQADYARKIYPGTSNTVRLLTIWDYSKNAPVVAAAAHRFGTARSFPTDNWKAGLGGLCSQVDLQNGELSRAVTVGDDQTLQWVDAHPETGEPITGLTLPNWSGLKSEIRRAARELFFVPQIAWDILMTNDHFSVLEVNGTPGLHVHQVHRPMLVNPQVQEFYRTHGVIR